jgi:glutaredoxin
MDSGRHKVEVFSAGCALCQEVIDEVKREVGSSEVIVRSMKDARSLARAEELGIRSVPAVVIDSKLASNAGGGVDIQALKSELHHSFFSSSGSFTTLAAIRSA